MNEDSSSQSEKEEEEEPGVEKYRRGEKLKNIEVGYLGLGFVLFLAKLNSRFVAVCSRQKVEESVETI